MTLSSAPEPQKPALSLVVDPVAPVPPGPSAPVPATQAAQMTRPAEIRD
jgi:hypothetical protein